MISLRERMVIATVSSAVAFVVFGMVMIGTGLNMYPAMIGFIIGAFGFQAIAYLLSERKRRNLRLR